MEKIRDGVAYLGGRVGLCEERIRTQLAHSIRDLRVIIATYNYDWQSRVAIVRPNGRDELKPVDERQIEIRNDSRDGMGTRTQQLQRIAPV